MPRPLDTSPAAMPAPGTFNRFVSRKEFSKRLGECVRSTTRRQNTDPEFPFTFYMNGHAFHTDTGVENYLQVLMRRGLRASGTYPANPHREPELTSP